MQKQNEYHLFKLLSISIAVVLACTACSSKKVEDKQFTLAPISNSKYYLIEKSNPHDDQFTDYSFTADFGDGFTTMNISVPNNSQNFDKDDDYDFVGYKYIESNAKPYVAVESYDLSSFGFTRNQISKYTLYIPKGTVMND